MDFTICTILHTTLFCRDVTILRAAETGLEVGLALRVDKSLHFLFAEGLETKSFLVAMLLITGVVLDWMKAYLVYSPQNARLFTLPFCLEIEKSFDSSLVCM